MHSITYQAIVAVGNIAEIYNLHQVVRRLLWDQGPDFVRILSPVCYGLADKLASFVLVPHGLQTGTSESLLVDGLLDRAALLIRGTNCQFVKVAFGGPGSPVVIAE